jgi:hypothetical protein
LITCTRSHSTTSRRTTLAHNARASRRLHLADVNQLILDAKQLSLKIVNLQEH